MLCKGRLARAVMSEHGDKAAPLDLQAHALEALNIVARVGVMQIFYFYN